MSRAPLNKQAPKEVKNSAVNTEGRSSVGLAAAGDDGEADLGGCIGSEGEIRETIRADFML